ncbi:MAG: hypothetical protein ACYCW6_18195, partial [Candidatus Xenobia bacterium]
TRAWKRSNNTSPNTNSMENGITRSLLPNWQSDWLFIDGPLVAEPDDGQQHVGRNRVAVGVDTDHGQAGAAEVDVPLLVGGLLDADLAGIAYRTVARL